MVNKWGDAEFYCTHFYLLFLLPIVSTVNSKDSLYLPEKGLLNISFASHTHHGVSTPSPFCLEFKHNPALMFALTAMMNIMI